MAKKVVVDARNMSKESLEAQGKVRVTAYLSDKQANALKKLAGPYKAKHGKRMGIGEGRRLTVNLLVVEAVETLIERNAKLVARG